MERRVGKCKKEKNMNLFHIKISYSDTLSNSYLLLKTQNFIQKMFTVVSNEGEIQLFSFRYPILCSKVVVPQMESQYLCGRLAYYDLLLHFVLVEIYLFLLQIKGFCFSNSASNAFPNPNLPGSITWLFSSTMLLSWMSVMTRSSALKKIIIKEIKGNQIIFNWL